MLRLYSLNDVNIESIVDEYANAYRRSSYFEFLANLYVQRQYKNGYYADLKHNFNTVNVFRICNSIPDAYSLERHTLFYYHGCIQHGHWISAPDPSADGRKGGIGSRNRAADPPIRPSGSRNRADSLQPCPLMPPFTTFHSKNMYNITYQDMHRQFYKLLQLIHKKEPQWEIIIIYECDFMASLYDNKTDVGHYFKTIQEEDYLSPYGRSQPQQRESIIIDKPTIFSPREVLKGGFVELYQIKADSADGRIYYFDINSMYPGLGISNSFPVGASLNLRGFDTIKRHLFYDEYKCQFYFKDNEGVIYEEIEGFALAKVFIDAKQHPLGNIPFLSVTYRKKTFRVFCFMCLKINNSKEKCNHTIEQKAFNGHYTLNELAYAISIGYVVLKIDEVVIYLKKEPIFKKVLLCVANAKIKAQPPPPSEKCLKNYCHEINIQMDFISQPKLILTPDQLQPNSVKVYFWKLIGNTLIGKLSQRNNLQIQTFVKNNLELNELFSNQENDIKHCWFVNDLTIQVTLEKKLRYLERNRNGNLFLNASLTALGRISLHKAMLSLQNQGFQVLYADTDSVICQEIKPHRPIQQILKIHPCIFGYWKSEIEEGLYIEKFLGISAKNYSYVVNEELTHKRKKEVIKVRGFSLKSKNNTKSFNFDQMYNFVKHWQLQKPHSGLALEQFRMIINGQEKIIHAKKVLKIYQLLSPSDCKRFFSPSIHNEKTFAYGTIIF